MLQNFPAINITFLGFAEATYVSQSTAPVILLSFAPSAFFSSLAHPIAPNFHCCHVTSRLRTEIHQKRIAIQVRGQAAQNSILSSSLFI
jgi:hypothetical protein